MLELFLKGVLIGVIASAPMGPAGILCIQRTLSKGRWHGFATGLGAAASDLFYSIITGLGLSVFLDFISSHLRSMQFLGSLLLLVMGAYIFMKKPFYNYRGNNNISASHLFKDFTTGFFFTVSNSFIIFLFIALFAHLGFITAKNDFISYIAGYGGILFGATGWWLLITTFFDKLRGKITWTQLRLVNRITGGIIILLSLAGIVSALLDKSIAIG